MTKKNKPIGRDNVRAEAVKWTADKLGCSKEYIRGLLNGNNPSTSDNAELIIKTYREKYAELKSVLS